MVFILMRKEEGKATIFTPGTDVLYFEDGDYLSVRLDSLLKEKRPIIILDINEVRLMPRNIIGILKVFANKCKDKKVRFACCGLQKMIRGAFEDARIHELVKTFENRAEALKALTA